MIIDTETHIFFMGMPALTNPHMSMVKHAYWHEHSAKLLVAEMDRAGVDKCIVISYDVEDILWYLERNHMGFEDFHGGKKYTKLGVQQYPDRLIWFTTVKNPKRHDAVAILRADHEAGARGIKMFPTELRCSMNEPAIMDIFRACAEMHMEVCISFEEIQPPETLDLETYLTQLEEVLDRFPSVNFGLNHGGCADPLVPGAADHVIALAQRYPNLWLGGAKVGNIWDDGSEYPFANHLCRLQILSSKIGAKKLMYATDWPYYCDRFLYEQGVTAIKRHTDFWTAEEKADYLGNSAARFLRLS